MANGNTNVPGISAPVNGSSSSPDIVVNNKPTPKQNSQYSRARKYMSNSLGQAQNKYTNWKKTQTPEAKYNAKVRVLTNALNKANANAILLNTAAKAASAAANAIPNHPVYANKKANARKKAAALKVTANLTKAVALANRALYTDKKSGVNTATANNTLYKAKTNLAKNKAMRNQMWWSKPANTVRGATQGISERFKNVGNWFSIKKLQTRVAFKRRRNAKSALQTARNNARRNSPAFIAQQARAAYMTRLRNQLSK